MIFWSKEALDNPPFKSYNTILHVISFQKMHIIWAVQFSPKIVSQRTVIKIMTIGLQKIILFGSTIFERLIFILISTHLSQYVKRIVLKNSFICVSLFVQYAEAKMADFIISNRSFSLPHTVCREIFCNFMFSLTLNLFVMI